MSDIQECQGSLLPDGVPLPPAYAGPPATGAYAKAQGPSLIEAPPLIEAQGPLLIEGEEPSLLGRDEPSLLENEEARTQAPARGNGKRPHAQAPPLRRILEAILFATDHPVTVEQLLYAVPGCAEEEVELELHEMAHAYEESGAGFKLEQSGGGYLLHTDPDLHEYVHRFLIGKKRTRLSRAAMEALAIVAYRQPVTRGEAETIRGVDCGQTFHTLLERDLITIRGRSQALGRPLLYGTTPEFLHYFGINSMADLPSLEELRALAGEDPLSDPEIRSVLEGEDAEVSEAVSSEEPDLGGALGDMPAVPEELERTAVGSLPAFAPSDSLPAAS